MVLAWNIHDSQHTLMNVDRSCIRSTQAFKNLKTEQYLLIKHFHKLGDLSKFDL
jgi:hypothetical protein